MILRLCTLVEAVDLKLFTLNGQYLYPLPTTLVIFLLASSTPYSSPFVQQSISRSFFSMTIPLKFVEEEPSASFSMSGTNFPCSRVLR
jgi:hypothetical protein